MTESGWLWGSIGNKSYYCVQNEGEESIMTFANECRSRRWLVNECRLGET
jgi:hypothetical protein